jgi:isoleucyl-tRNA synthetase
MFKAVDSKVSLPELEEQVSEFWKKDRTFEKSIEQRSPDNSYTFVDGPPFVTGSPHYGSLLPSIAKDVIPRYQTMIGKRVRRVWGWDCHGLPIEERVNQKLGIKSSRELEEFGIGKYIQECKKYVEGVTSDWRWYVDKIGRWADLDNAYKTMDPDYMESVIWAFKQIYDKGLIYKGKRVSLFSTDTSTPVSNFEVAMDPDNYQDVEDLSVFVKFELKDIPDFIRSKGPIFMVAWTTTPWTIPSNFALAVNEKFDYVLVEYDTELYIVAKERLEYTFVDKNLVNILQEFKGGGLEGLSYKPVYDFFEEEAGEGDFKVYLSDDVTVEDGTGVLHMAPAFGEVDYQMGLKYGISPIPDIDEEGKMTVGEWKGIYLRDASPLIAEDMRKRGSLLRSQPYTHRLPFYRGKNPLIYMVQDAYFIDIQKIKDRMLELNENINWIPKHIKEGRFAETIKTSPDWCISRNRYWATVMPIWMSEDGEELVIGQQILSLNTLLKLGLGLMFYIESLQFYLMI